MKRPKGSLFGFFVRRFVVHYNPKLFQLKFASIEINRKF